MVSGLVRVCCGIARTEQGKSCESLCRAAGQGILNPKPGISSLKA